MTNHNLQEFKNILLKLNKEQKNSLNNSKRADEMWNFLSIKKINIEEILHTILMTDLLIIYDKIFFDSKLLSIQILPRDTDYPLQNENNSNKPKKSNWPKEEIVYKNTNFILKINHEFEDFDKIESFNVDNQYLYLNYTEHNKMKDEDDRIRN